MRLTFLHIHTFCLSSRVRWIAQFSDAKPPCPIFTCFPSTFDFVRICMCLPAHPWKPGYFKHQSGCFSGGGSKSGSLFLSLCLRDKYKQTQLGHTGQVIQSALLPLQASAHYSNLPNVLSGCLIPMIQISPKRLTYFFAFLWMCVCVCVCVWRGIKPQWHIYTFLSLLSQRVYRGFQLWDILTFFPSQSQFENRVSRGHAPLTETLYGKLIQLWKMWLLLV